MIKMIYNWIGGGFSCSNHNDLYFYEYTKNEKLESSLWVRKSFVLITKKGFSKYWHRIENSPNLYLF